MKKKETENIRSIVRSAVYLLRGLLSSSSSLYLIIVLIAYKRFDDLYKRSDNDENNVIIIPGNCRWANLQGVEAETLPSTICNNLNKIINSNRSALGISESIKVEFEEFEKRIPHAVWSTLLHILNSLDLSDDCISKDELDYIISSFLDRSSPRTSLARSRNESTPTWVNEIMVHILNPSIGDKVLDIGSGFGGTLLAVLKHFYTKGDRDSSKDEAQYKLLNEQDENRLITGYEFDKKEALIASLRLAMSGYAGKYCLKEQHFTQDMLFSTTNINNKADVIFIKLPYGELLNIRSKYIRTVKGIDVEIPKRHNELSYLLSAIEQLSDRGRIAAVIDQHILTADREVKKFRQFLVENDYVESVIELPGDFNYRPSSSMMLILNNNKQESKKGKIKFILMNAFDEEKTDSEDQSNLLYNRQSSLWSSNFRRDYSELNKFMYWLKSTVDESYSSNFNKYTRIVTKDNIKIFDYDLAPARYVGDLASELQKIINDKAARRIDQVCEIVRGRILKQGKSSAGLPFISTKDLSKDINNIYLDFRDVAYVIPQQGSQLLDKKCILVSLVGTELKPTIYDPENDNKTILIGHNIAALIPDESSIDMQYLYYQLYTPFVRKQIQAGMAMTGIPSISLQKLRNIIIPVPEKLEVQRNFTIPYKASLIEAEAVKKIAIAESQKVAGSKQEAEFGIIRHVAHSVNPKINMVRSPLKAIRKILEANGLLNTAVSTREDGSIETVKEALDHAFNSLDNIRDIIQSVRGLVTREIHRSEFEFVNICRLFDDVKSHYIGKDYFITIKCNVRGKVLLHTHSFKEAIDNIIRNAEMHAFINDQDTKELIFDIAEREGFIIIDYTNNGLPFPEDITEKEFLSYGKHGKDSPGEGLGGAWIAKVIEAHKGAFEIVRDSAPVHFVITFPRGEESNESV